MTYHATATDGIFCGRRIHGSHCFCCGVPLVSMIPVIAYDAYPSSDGQVVMLMHRDCAFAMAQRIIVDAWLHRREGPPLRTDAQ